MHPYGFQGNRPFYPQQPPAAPPQRGSRRRGAAIGLLISGGILCLIWAVVPRIPIPMHESGGTGYLSLSQLHGLCDSSLGQFGQAMSASASRACAMVSLGMDILTLCLLGGIGLAAAGILLLTRQRPA